MKTRANILTYTITISKINPRIVSSINLAELLDRTGRSLITRFNAFVNMQTIIYVRVRGIVLTGTHLCPSWLNLELNAELFGKTCRTFGENVPKAGKLRTGSNVVCYVVVGVRYPISRQCQAFFTIRNSETRRGHGCAYRAAAISWNDSPETSQHSQVVVDDIARFNTVFKEDTVAIVVISYIVLEEQAMGTYKAVRF